MKKILVMGGTYFIGKRLVEFLLKCNYDVYILNRGTRYIDDNRIHQLTCNRNNIADMKIILKDYTFDFVIDVSGLDKTQAQILCNSLKTDNIKRFIFLSSSSVYDIENLSIPFKESNTLKENKYWTTYGKNKIEAERFYTSYFANIQTKLIILRPPYVYGENNYARRESFIFNHIFNNQPILVPTPNFKLQFIYTSELANIIIKLLEEKLDQLSIFNVGNKHAVTILEWVELCAKACGKSANIIEYDYHKYNRKIKDFFPFYDYNNILDVEKINMIYCEETSMEVGLKATFDWFFKNKDIIEFKKEVYENEKIILNELKSTFQFRLDNIN